MAKIEFTDDDVQAIAMRVADRVFTLIAAKFGVTGAQLVPPSTQAQAPAGNGSHLSAVPPAQQPAPAAAANGETIIQGRPCASCGSTQWKLKADGKIFCKKFGCRGQYQGAA